MNKHTRRSSLPPIYEGPISSTPPLIPYTTKPITNKPTSVKLRCKLIQIRKQKAKFPLPRALIRYQANKLQESHPTEDLDFPSLAEVLTRIKDPKSHISHKKADP